MNGWMGQEMWILTTIGVLVVILLFVVIRKMSNKQSGLIALPNLGGKRLIQCK
jgi:hypothetical protein